MVRLFGAAALLFSASLLWPSDAPKTPSSPKAPASATDAAAADTGPVLYGDTAGRLWKWQAGEKTWLTDGKQKLILGGAAETELWGWSVTGGDARTFTLALPKKKDSGSTDPPAKTDTQASNDPKGKSASETKPEIPPVPQFDQGVFPVPDLADRAGTWVVAVYGPQAASPRLELYQMGLPYASLAWDDGRVVYVVSVASDGRWLAAGRTREGQPWLNRNGRDVEAPASWRGRLIAADAAGQRAAGWGAPGEESPTALFWTNGAWTRPAPEEGAVPTGGTFPVLGQPGPEALELAGWRADAGTGALRPWFWDGAAETVGQTAADGKPVAFGNGKKGAFLVVRHESEPFYTLEDGTESVVLEGLGADDRVAASGKEKEADEKTP